MIKQMIRRVDFHAEDGELVPRFGPLMNSSQIKNYSSSLSNSANLRWKQIQADNNPERLTEASIRNEFYDNAFPTLVQLNKQGWKLESFAIIWDANDLKLQVAIFSRTE